VTVIATGFAATSPGDAEPVVRPNLAARKVSKPAAVPMVTDRSVVSIEVGDPADLEIPTFIRRQMD
jgi:hypothetical protein